MRELTDGTPTPNTHHAPNQAAAPAGLSQTDGGHAFHIGRASRANCAPGQLLCILGGSLLRLFATCGQAQNIPLIYTDDCRSTASAVADVSRVLPCKSLELLLLEKKLRRLTRPRELAAVEAA
eukprot:3929218-Prymnesium_polylepis.1